MRPLRVGALSLLIMGAAACAPTRKSAAGFHLPDGDPQRGQQAFVDFRCHTCHRVTGADELPAPLTDPPVVLGGVVYRVFTDGELTNAIVEPSHRLAPSYPAAAVTSGKLSRMGDQNDQMTVRQLVDLVAFLQSRYDVREPEMPYR
jgi:mono/diheme cytochrome c family protein